MQQEFKSESLKLIIRKDSTALIANVDFKLPDNIGCSQVSLSFSTIFCFYVSQKRVAVQIINYINDEIPMIQVDLQSIGLDYKVQYDSPEYTLFTYIHQSETSFVIMKLYKHINQYQVNMLTAGDFGVSSIFIQNYFAFFESDNNVLNILFINTLSNTLNLYRGKVNLEDYGMHKLKTLNDSVSLNSINKLIWRIDCRNQM